MALSVLCFMYYYIYDTYLSETKYEKIIDRVKTRLLDLEIQGRHEKLTLLKSVDELVVDEAKRGTTTIIVVGNDKTFLKIVDAAAKNNITLGYIPIGDGNGNGLAECLGLPPEDKAAEVIAARKIVSFDLGRVANQYFFSDLTISKNLDRLSIEKDNYKIVPQADCVEIGVSNFYFPVAGESFDRRMKKFSAQDQRLELVIKIKSDKKHWFSRRPIGKHVDSIIQGTEFRIKSFEYLPITLDGYKILKTPVVVDVAPVKLKVIVGKSRLGNII